MKSEKEIRKEIKEMEAGIKYFSKIGRWGSCSVNSMQINALKWVLEEE